MQTYDELLNKALSLNEKERALMVESLIRSLEPVVDVDAEKEWQMEIEKRIKEIDENETELLNWETARKNLRRK